jgi:hypothetical protein
MIKTGSLVDPVWNPWPSKTQNLLERAGVDLFYYIGQRHGKQYLHDLTAYVGELIEKRNKIAHGDNSVTTTVTDIRRYMQWSSRLARSCDEALGMQLGTIIGSSGWP